MISELAQRGSERWNAGTALIETVYQHMYGAVIPSHADELVMVSDRQGRVLAATGLREAGSGFFSEIYLEATAALAISASLQRRVMAEDVLEVVTLAAAAPAAMMPLFAAVVAQGHRRGKTCCLFTATSRLRRIFRKMGLGLVEIAAADARRLENADTWGRYYMTDPKVCVIAASQSADSRMRNARAVA